MSYIRNESKATVDLELQGKSTQILDSLRALKKGFEEKNLKLSRPHLCALYIWHNIADPLYIKAIVKLNENNQMNFCFNWDLYWGVLLTVSSIPAAESEMSGEFDQTVAPPLSETCKALDLSVAKEVEEFLELKDSAKEGSQSLKKDPTGLSLVNSWVERFRSGDERVVANYHSKEYVLAGAELARDLYEKFYQIAAPLYPGS